MGSKLTHPFFKQASQHIWSANVGNVAFPPESNGTHDCVPEVAFVGRSNVGKSTLINSLLNRNGLARTSQKPGATRGIHFYQVAETMNIVDLPGYGYAAVSKTLAKDIRSMLLNYLETRRTLKKVYVLVDGRHGLKDVDVEMLQALVEAGITTQVILTKMDKVKGSKAQYVIRDVQEQLENYPGVISEIFPISAPIKDGIKSVQYDILSVCNIK
jgi:GTP-binding protein